MVLNGDSLTDLDLTALQRQHAETGAVVTLGLYPVDDPTSFGLVRRDRDGHVLGFLEKPEPDEVDTDEVSAGTYVIERRVLDLIPAGPGGLDRARGLPAPCRPGPLRPPLGGLLGGHRNPRSIPAGELGHPRGRGRDRVRPSAGGPRVEDGASVADGAEVEPRAVVRRACEIGDGAGSPSRCCSKAAGSRRRRGRGAILAAGVEVGDGAEIGPAA